MKHTVALFNSFAEREQSNDEDILFVFDCELATAQIPPCTSRPHHPASLHISHAAITTVFPRTLPIGVSKIIFPVVFLGSPARSARHSR